MDLLGHERQIAEMRSDLQTGNIAHAYLFAGPPHIGKFTVAKWFAKQLLLQKTDVEHAAKTEHMIDRLLHPDLLVLDRLWMEETFEDWNEIAKYSNVPQEHRKKAGAKTDRISIDDIRAIQDRIAGTGGALHRAICIRSIERMEDPPANALLKMLEEPPAGCVFLLTTQNMSELLPTVVSRCRVLRFAPLATDDLQPLLAAADPADAQFLRHVSQGAPGLIKRLLDDPELLRAEKLLHTQASAFWRASSLHERLKLLEPLHERGEGAKRMLLHLALTLREQRPLPVGHEYALRALHAALDTNAQRPIQIADFALRLAANPAGLARRNSPATIQ